MTAQVGPPNQQQISFAAGANVTLSSSSSGGSKTITIIGGGTGATGTGINFSAGTQQATSGTVLFANSNSISFGMAGSSQITASIAFPAFGSQTIGASNLGNLSGTSGVASGSAAQMLFAGGNNVTLSQSVNGASATITISAFTQTVQTQNRFNLTISGNTSGALAAISSGTVTLVGGNNITLSQAGNVITISAPTPAGLQTAVSGIIAGTTTATSGTVSFANSNGISFGLNGQTITGSVVGGNQASLSGNTAGVLALISTGTMILAGGNNVTLSQNGNSITISAPNTAAQSVQTQSNIQAIIPLGNTVGTTGTIQTGSFGFAAGNNITISQSSGANSTNLTIIGGAGVPSVGGIGNTTGTFTTGGGSLILAGGNNVTLSGSTAAGGMTVSISVPATASQTVQTQNLFDFQISSAAGGATSGTTALVSSGTLTFAAGSNITLSQVGNAITINAGQSTQTQSLGAIQIGAGAGSTTGTTAQITLGTMTLNAGANITISQAGGNALTIQGVQLATDSIGISTHGNTAGTTNLVSGSGVRMLFVGQNNVTLSQSVNGSSLTLSIVDALVGTKSLWTPPHPGSPAALQQGASSLFLFPALVDNYVTASQVNVPISISLSTSSNSSHAGTLSMALGVYTRSGSTLSTVSSGSVSYAWTNTSDNSTASISGLRYVSLPLNMNMTPGDYWIGFLSQTNTANANWITISNIVHTAQAISGTWLAAANNTNQIVEGFGHLNSTTNAMPASVAISNLNATNVRDQATPVLWFVNHSA